MRIAQDPARDVETGHPDGAPLLRRDGVFIRRGAIVGRAAPFGARSHHLRIGACSWPKESREIA